MNRKDNSAVVEIDLLKLAMACLKKWWLILIITILSGAAAFLYTSNFVTPLYQSTVKLYVNNSDLSVGNVSISTSDLSASVQLVDVYEAILDTKDTLDVVIEQAGLSYDYTELSSMLTTSSVNDTQVFQITVTSPSPSEAALIASTIGDVLPEVISNIIDSADARIIEHAITPTHRSSPSYSSNTLRGALVGFVVIVGILVVLELMNTTIRDESDFADIIDVPILAYIPDINSKTVKSKYYKSDYKTYYKSYGQ